MNVMTCREMETLLRDMALESPTIESQAMPSDGAAHLASCPRCSAALERERRLTASLAALGGSVEDCGDPATVETRLRAAFREHWHDHADRRCPIFQLAARKPSLWAAGTAAILVVSLGVAWIERQPSGAPPGAPMEPSAAPTASLASSPTAEPTAIPRASGAETAGLNPSTADAARPLGRRPRNDLPSEDATPAGSLPAVALPETEQTALQRPPQVSSEFVPLFYGGDPQLLEAGQVWRVELPRGALQSVGMPVVEESRAGLIQVDILLGEDGIARAIRLVQ